MKKVMKKGFKSVISILVMCALAAMLIACGADEVTSTTCAIEQDGTSVEITMEAKGDIITKWTQTSILSMEGVDDATKELLEEALEQMKTEYAKYSNVKYTGQVNADSVKEVVEIDMTDKDGVQALVDAGLLPVEGNASRLSMKQTVENLKSQGYTVK